MLFDLNFDYFTNTSTGFISPSTFLIRPYGAMRAWSSICMELGETHHTMWTYTTIDANVHAFYILTFYFHLVDISGPHPTVMAKTETSTSVITISRNALINVGYVTPSLPYRSRYTD